MRTRNSSDLAQVLAEAQDIARNVGHPLSSTHVLLALFTVPNRAEVLLRDRRITEDVVLDAIGQVEHESEQVVQGLLDRAHTLASQAGTREVDCLHLLLAVLRSREVVAHRLLVKGGLDVVGLRNQAMSYLTGQMPRRLREVLQPQGDRRAAEQTARDRRAGLLSGAVIPPSPEARRPPPHAKRTPAAPEPPPRRDEAPEPPPKKDAPADGGEKKARAASPQKPRRATTPPPPKGEGGKWDLDPTEFPWLSSLGRNLTQLAHEGRIDPVIGRDKEIEEVVDVLGKRRTNNPVLVGEPGVGKTAIVEGLASALLALGERAGPLYEKVVVELDMASILAGTHLRGSFSEKLGGIKDEVKSAGGRVIVFIDEIHTLVGAGATGEGPQDAANELKAALARGEFPCVGATTHDEYRKFIESDPALERRFTPVLVTEPSEADAVRILEGLSEHYGAHHGVSFDPSALEAAVTLSSRYVTDRCLPDKAIGLLDLAGSRSRREGRTRVEAVDVARVVSKIASVPEERLLMTDAQRFLAMEEALSGRIVGHGEVVSRVCQVVRRNYAGFDSHRPMGSFLFLGPTGVGKTELAKALAEFLYGSESALIRADMSEFSEPNTVARLIGAPPGYVGYGEGGQLTEPVRRRPFSVVLLDEVEKAHRDVLQLLLQVLDEGHLTDGRGRQVSFANTVVVMTSNLGAEAFERTAPRSMGFLASGDETKERADRSDRVVAAARGAFPPELWNRIDERLVFAPLLRDEVALIAERMLADSSGRLAAEKRIAYRAGPEVVAHLIEEGGYDASLGARPMRRTIQRLVEAPLAERILAGEVAPGDDVLLEMEDGSIAFRPLRRAG